MKTLTSKNLRFFLLFTTLILLCCGPLLFFLMKYFYAKDLDELIIYRADEFISTQLPGFSQADIITWNTHNEDIGILPYDPSYVFGKTLQEPYFNKAEGHAVDYRIIYMKIEIENKPFVLMSRIPMIENHDLLGTMIAQYGLLFLILLVALTLLLRSMSKRLWKPFYRTLHKVEHFNLESGTIPEFEQTTTVEFARLNEQLKNLLTDNLSIYQRQKEFIENASHELQTPLAILKSQLDMLLQQTDLTQTQFETIRSLYAISTRMTRMNKNLLLLARIANNQFIHTEELDFVNILYEQLLYLRRLAEEEGLKMNVQVNSPLKIKANRFLLESFINNLVVNAIQHNVENGIINILITRNGFEISNTGVAQPLDTGKIFQRFYHTSEKKKGNGLGLSILRQIADTNGWEINYTYSESIHTFTVVLHQGTIMHHSHEAVS